MPLPPPPESADLSHAKLKLRREMLARLRALPQELICTKSAALRRRLMPELAGARGLRICVYASLPHEVQLLPLLEELPAHSYYFPLCRPGRQLSFHRVQHPAQDLTAGALGILAPRPELPELPPDAADIILVPGVAFTPEGERLGYGGGYYDRFLPRCPQARTIALCLAEQLRPELPVSEHDCRISRVISC
ncbi:MAG: 5-formyltetrahydrofolate cyclo-ligase [Akkermansiaceae bacterium]|nr:5-formyltetrahydrofolate cyclo-ligase [Akkermansiaceae bacterium]